MSLSPRVRLCLGLWVGFAFVVFNVTYDWQTRMAGHTFAAAQLARHAQGRPLPSIDDAFRPLVAAAARESGAWAVTIAALGIAATTAAARASK
jgi:hypothetical protein